MGSKELQGWEEVVTAALTSPESLDAAIPKTASVFFFLGHRDSTSPSHPPLKAFQSGGTLNRHVAAVCTVGLFCTDPADADPYKARPLKETPPQNPMSPIIPLNKTPLENLIVPVKDSQQGAQRFSGGPSSAARTQPRPRRRSRAGRRLSSSVL